MFVIPKNLEDLTAAAIRRDRGLAAEEYNTALAAAREDPEAVSDEQLTRLEALSAFISDADAALNLTSTTPAESAGDVGDRLGALAPALAEDPVPVVAGDDTTSTVTAPTVADVAGQGIIGGTATRVVEQMISRAAITASAGLTGFTAGQELDGIGGIAQAMVPRLESYVGAGAGISKDPIATIKMPPTEFAVTGDRRDIEVVSAAVDETKLPGGSLVEARYQAFMGHGERLEAVTASGWCAPSEVDYTTQFHGAASGLYDLPTITASRGGVWIMPEISFANIFGLAPAPGAAYFHLTEAQVIAGTAKTFVTADCPTPTEYRLGVTGFGLVVGLLQVRAYPEYVREFTRASLIGLQHFRSLVNIAAVVAGSTAVNLTAVLPWSTDESTLSVVLPAAEMAAVDQRYRARLAPTATIEQVFPIWVLAQIRADFMRRNGTGGDPSIADAWIMSWFRDRNIAPQFIYNWQDRMDTVSGGLGYPGSATPITALPNTVKFLSYPAGTWVNAVADVIQLSTVYDSVRLASNECIEMFTEQGNIVIPRRGDSRVYTVNICPSGHTSSLVDVDCTT